MLLQSACWYGLNKGKRVKENWKLNLSALIQNRIVFKKNLPVDISPTGFEKIMKK
jgi:hypothetical protein